MADRAIGAMGASAAERGPESADPLARHSPDQHLVLTDEQLQRWAGLVADGSEPFPEGLEPRQHQQMLRQVRELRRRRLVQFIAGRVAAELHTRTGDQHGG